MANLRQKLAFQKMVENGGNISKAMRDAGYSINTAKTPSKLTNTKAWQELFMEKSLSDEDLLLCHRELFNAVSMEHLSFPLGIDIKELEEIFTDVDCKPLKSIIGKTKIDFYFLAPDNKQRIAALNMAYRLRGIYINR